MTMPLKRLQRPENQQQKLEQVISYRIIPAKITSTAQASEIKALNRQPVVELSIQATNGAIYPIGSVWFRSSLPKF